MTSREPDNAYGPDEPPMLRWQRLGCPGWPFHHPGGPMVGTIGYVVGEQFKLMFDTPTPAPPVIEDNEGEGE